MLAISLMKLILVARKALAAYLIISALVRSVSTSGTGACRGRGPFQGKFCSTRGRYSSPHHGQRPRTGRAEHDAIREEHVLDRAALAEELRVGDHVEVRQGQIGGLREGYSARADTGQAASMWASTVSQNASRTSKLTQSPEPTGTVLLVTITR